MTGKSREKFSITSFKKRGVLTRVFVSFMTLSMTLLVLFLAAGMAILNERYEEQSLLSTQDMLDKAQVASTIAIQQTLDSIHQIAQNESIISAIAVPDINNTSRAMEIVTHLQYVQQQNRYIEKLYFYSAFDDVVYSCTGSVNTRESFFAKDIIDVHHETRIFSDKPLSEREKYDFFIYRNQVFITYAFPVAAPYENGIIYAKLSKDALGEILDLRTQDSEQLIQVYSPRNEPILNVQEPVSENILNQVSAEPQTITDGSRHIFLCQSPKTGLKFVYSRPAAAKQIPILQYLLILLPTVPVILLMSIVMSVNLTEYLYKPIRKMMNTLSGGRYNKEPVNGTELDYLGEALSDFVVRNEDLNKVMTILRPEVENKVFHSLVTGTMQEEEINDELLETIQLSKDACCTVVAVQVTDDNCRPLGKLEANMYILAIKQQLLDYNCTCGSQKLVETEDDMLAVVLNFPSETRELSILQEARKLQRFILNQNLSCQLFVAAGGIYTDLNMLHNSYTDACQTINYQKYLHDDAKAAAEDTAPSYYKNYILSQLNQALSERNFQKAEQLVSATLEKVFNQFEENHESPKAVRIQCNGFIDLLIGLMSDLNCVDDIGLERSAIGREIEAISENDELLRYMKQRFSQYLQIIIYQQNKQNNKHISAAKDYIQKHYSEYSLSLDVVAQNIGIHPNYLSRLFKETLNINFVEYLNKQRIEKAKVLLSTTQMTVRDIGFEVGFNSVQNYIRVFKKIEKMTPTQFRETHMP